jgi:hypothetical protein
VQTGQCVFLPKLKPQAFIIRSARIRLLMLVTPAGLEDVFRDMSTPALKLEVPYGALPHSQADLNQTVQRFTEYGVRILSPEEAAHQLPQYPSWLPPNAANDRLAARERFVKYESRAIAITSQIPTSHH